MSHSLSSWGHAVPPLQRAALAPLFSGISHTYILDGVLEGLIGEARTVYGTDQPAGYIAFADVLYIGGNADSPEARDLISRLPFFKALFLDPNSLWLALAREIWGQHLVEIERYTFPKATFDVERLRDQASSIPEGFCITPINMSLAQRIIDTQEVPILEDHIRHFGSAEDFMRHGFGFCILAQNEIVALISTYAVSRAGVEIQISTHPDYRRLGLATALGANFILHCLEHGLDPHWDAANATSCRLAEKLGYTGYTPYSVWLLVDEA
ncbi:MAG: GNAT family N-acetyltransferase [Anaerolineae bacterium]|nr:GNAT family N-acetyltransferase [Anaerolineae bacterium]